MAEKSASSKTAPGPDAGAPTHVAAADPGLVPGAAGPAKAEVAA